MAHDTAHFYAILEPTFESLDLQNHKRCEQFNACLKRITPNEPFPKELTPAQETQKKKQNAQRIALFDFLHESGLGKFFHYSDIGGSIDRISFHTILENAFQSVLGRKDGKFSFDSFLGDEDDKRKICASLKQLPSLEKEADDSIINRRLESKKLPIVVFDLFPKGKYQQLMTKNKHAIRTVPIQLSGVTFRGEKAHIPHLADEFLLRLKNICEVDFPKGIPPSTDKNNETLEKKLHEAIEKGFPEEVEKNIDQQIEAIHTIQKGLEKTPECKEFFYRK